MHDQKLVLILYLVMGGVGVGMEMVLRHEGSEMDIALDPCKRRVC